MIITCPDCATSYELPSELIGPNGRLVQCDECGKIWTQPGELPESKLIFQETPAVSSAGLPDAHATAPEPPQADMHYLESSDVSAVVDDGEPEPIETLEYEEVPPDVPGTALMVVPQPPSREEVERQERINVQSEAARLARASHSAKLAYERKRQKRVRTLRGWGVLAASVTLLTAPAVAFPHQVTVMFPAAAQLYAKAGVHVNTRGLEFREISYRRVLEEGSVVLEVEGKVVNVSGIKHELAPVHISLLDDQKHSLYSWTLKAEPGVVEAEEAATFKTRLAAPPDDATNLRVRFALPGEAP
ncbi:MAG: zinc-ribbon domain-containing protein [Pseudomonadota bacterium]